MFIKDKPEEAVPLAHAARRPLLNVTPQESEAHLNTPPVLAQTSTFSKDHGGKDITTPLNRAGYRPCPTSFPCDEIITGDLFD